MNKIIKISSKIVIFLILISQMQGCQLLKLGQVKPINTEETEIVENIDTKNPLINIRIPINSKIVFVGGQEVPLDSPPAYVDNNLTTMVPLRLISDIIGAKVDWLPDTKEIIITQEDKEIKLQINSYVALVNLIEEQLVSPPQIKDERAFVPLKFIAVTLGFNSEWIPETKTIVLTK